MQFMRRIRRTMLLAAIATAACCAGAQTGPEAEIKTLELRLSDLVVHGNWDEYEKHLAPDYTRIASHGKLLNKEDVMADFRTGPRKIIVMEPEELQIRIHEGDAILQGQLTTSVRESGRVTTRVERFTHVFVKKDGEWLLAAEQETTIGK